MKTGDAPILQVCDLVKHFPVVGESLFARAVGVMRPVDGVSFSIHPGQTLGLVGESGCGKTTLGRCVLQLQQPTAGEVIFEGQTLTALTETALRPIRRKMQVIFQAMNPSLIVCDEPVSASDVSIQAQIINLLAALQERLGLTYLFIAHDLSVVRHISDRVAVMYLGKIVEMTDRQQLYENPLHPYTKALLSAVPIPDPEVESRRERIALRGEVPSPLSPPSGCVFRPRCPIAVAECAQVIPELREVQPGHQVACIRV